jgi:hypothetical protein
VLSANRIPVCDLGVAHTGPSRWVASTLGSFIGPGVTGVLASRLSLPLALAVPAVLVAATALGADAVRGNAEGPSDPPV